MYSIKPLKNVVTFHISTLNPPPPPLFLVFTCLDFIENKTNFEKAHLFKFNGNNNTHIS